MTKLYEQYAPWWPLMSAPADYAEEAELFARVLSQSTDPAPPAHVLELGSGGGNNAFHLKKHFAMTLVDASPQMLEVSRQLNPECEHAEGDMRDVRLGHEFDAVFIHDAIMYMTSESELRRVFATAFVHCREGGTALFVPDWVRETFRPSTKHGGHDGKQRAMRYLQWIHDPDPRDTTCVCDFVYLFREADATVKVDHDQHLNGVFPRQTWVRLLGEAGFRTRIVADPFGREIFLGMKGTEAERAP